MPIGRPFAEPHHTAAPRRPNSQLVDIEDVLAYLRLTVNPADDRAFLRVAKTVCGQSKLTKETTDKVQVTYVLEDYIFAPSKYVAFTTSLPHTYKMLLNHHCPIIQTLASSERISSLGAVRQIVGQRSGGGVQKKQVRDFMHGLCAPPQRH